MPKEKSRFKPSKSATKPGKSASKKAAATTPAPMRRKKSDPSSKKSASKKSPVRRSRVQISSDEIARRAYFIAERRRDMDWGGDETSDWVEAERQLKLEALEAARVL